MNQSNNPAQESSNTVQESNCSVQQTNNNIQVVNSKSKFALSVGVSIAAALTLALVIYPSHAPEPVDDPMQWVQVVGPEQHQQFEVAEMLAMSPIDSFGKFRRGAARRGVGQVLLRCKVCDCWSGPFEMIDSGRGTVVHAPSAGQVHVMGCTIR